MSAGERSGTRISGRSAGRSYTFLNGVPRSITQVLSPRDEHEREHHFAWYAQDQWTLKRLTVNAGLRFDYQYEWVPEQVSGPGPFVPFRDVAGGQRHRRLEGSLPAIGSRLRPVR